VENGDIQYASVTLSTGQVDENQTKMDLFAATAGDGATRSWRARHHVAQLPLPARLRRSPIDFIGGTASVATTGDQS
jgi:hypothetical protein